MAIDEQKPNTENTQVEVQAAPMPEVPKEPLPFEGLFVGNDFELDDIISPVNSNTVLRNTQANTELGNIIAPLVKSDPEQLTYSLESGDDAALVQAEDQALEEATGRTQEIIQQKLQNSNSPEESLEILKEGKKELDKPINIGLLRSNYLTKKLNPEIDELDSISSRIERDLTLAAQIDKNINKYWETTGLSDVLVDFGELVLPVIGGVEEERIKYENSIDSIVENIAKAAPEKQAEVLQSVLDTWVGSESLLLGNNNSLLTVDRMESLREAILDGGLGVIDGSISEQQGEDIVMSALTGTIVGTELKALGKGIKGIFKFLLKDIAPNDEDLFKKPSIEGELLEKEKPSVGGLLDHRSSSRTIDAEYSIKPDNFLIEKQDGLKDLTTSAGLTEEQAIDRMTPNITDKNDVAFGNSFEEITELNDLVLIDESEVNMGMKRARVLEKQTGNSLKVVDSGVTLTPNDDVDSLGNFVFTLGDSNKKGFDTREQAELAGKLGMKGLEFNTIESNGKFFNTYSMKHQFDPSKDVKDLHSDMRSRFNSNTNLFVDPLRSLGKDVLDGVFALKGVNRSKVTERINKFNKSVKSFTHIKSEQLSKALKYGDDNSVEFTSKEQFANALGTTEGKVSDSTFTAYKELRGIMEDVYAVRNDNFRRLKSNQGYRMVELDGDGNLAKPIEAHEVRGSVLNADTKQKASLEDINGRILVRVDSPIVAEDGSLYRTLAVMPDTLGELPTQLLRKRTGHLDRLYRETGWTIKSRSTKNIDGLNEDVYNTSHIVKSRKDALAIKEQMISEGMNPDDIHMTRSRENNELDRIFGDPDSVQYSYSSTHSLKRGEQLKGSDGLDAPVLDPLESIQKSMFNLQREYDAPMIASLKTRFINQFAPYLKNDKGTPWSRDLREMLKTSEMPKEVANAADQWHNYIKGMQSLETSQVFKFLDDMIEELLPVSSDTAGISAKSQQLASNLIILGRPLYQIPQNLFQATYVAIREPIHGTKAVAQTPFVLSNLTGVSSDTKLLSKVLGVNEAVGKDLIKTIKSSGLWDSVGRADDFLEMSQNELTTGTSNWLKFYGKKYGSGTVRKPFEASKSLQETSVKMVNLYAYLTEFNKQVVKQGKPYNNATKKDISFRVQHLTQTQNGINQFSYQNKGNMWSIALQFMQHTHKLLLDVVLDPAVMSATGKNIGKVPSPFAESRTTALFTTGTVFTMFGFNGIFGENVGQYFSNKIREQSPEFAEVPAIRGILDGGLINDTFNEAFVKSGHVDVSGKVNPASFIDSFYDFFLNKGGSVDMFGAAGTTIGSILDTAKAAKTLALNPVMDTRDKAFNIAFEIGGLVKGLSDAERAFIAGNTGTWTYSSTLSGNLKVTEEEALFALFNVTPTMVADYYNNRGSMNSKSKPTDVAKLSKVFIKAMNRELAIRKSEGTLNTPLDSFEIIEKYSTMAKAAVDPHSYSSVENAFKTFSVGVGGETYENYIKPYINVETTEQRRRGLERLLQIASTPEAEEEIKAAIEMTEILIPQTKEIYGEK